LEDLRDVFDEIDTDGDGYITLSEFEKRLNDENVIAYFNSLKLDVSDARALFELMDFDHSEEVNINEFVQGCHKLQGESRALDMKIMQCEVRFIKEMVMNFFDAFRAFRGEHSLRPGRNLKGERCHNGDGFEEAPHSIQQGDLHADMLLPGQVHSSTRGLG